jgi:hypothetical protein
MEPALVHLGWAERLADLAGHVIPGDDGGQDIAAAGTKLCFMGHALMENRHGLVVQAEATEANGTGERKTALELLDRQVPGTSNQLTLGADKVRRASSSPTCGRSASLRTWRRRPGAPPPMAEPRGMSATP